MPATKKSQPRGSVLMFTMVILLIMGLLGLAIFLNTVTDLQISSNTTTGRSTFNKADAAARLGVLFGRVALSPGAGSPADYISSDGGGVTGPAFEVRLSENFSLDSFAQIGSITTVEDIKERYLRTTGAAGYGEPLLTVLYEGLVVGTVAIDLNLEETTPRGGSLEDEGYNKESGSVVATYLVVTADGRLPKGSTDDAGHYFTGHPGTTHSIINTIYREVLQ